MAASRGPVDYYLDPDEPPGLWWGEGCAAMGVAGQVEPEQLARLLNARHPAGGHRLGRSFGTKSARSFDATFSTPKSASALWALTDDPWALTDDPWARAEVLAGHDAAVLAALEWFQQHGAATRRGKDGVHQVDTRGLVIALFRQHTSRSADPQLHTHAVISSKVQDLTGKWLALDARFLKRQQRSISWVYSAALRSELASRLGVSWGPAAEGHAEIDGVPAGILNLFSQRTEQVEAKTAELITGWIEEHDGAEPDARTIYKLERAGVLASRPSKHGAVDAEALRAEWTHRAREAGFERLTLLLSQSRLPGTTPVDVDDEDGPQEPRRPAQGRAPRRPGRRAEPSPGAVRRRPRRLRLHVTRGNAPGAKQLPVPRMASLDGGRRTPKPAVSRPETHRRHPRRPYGCDDEGADGPARPRQLEGLTHLPARRRGS